MFFFLFNCLGLLNCILDQRPPKCSAQDKELQRENESRQVPEHWLCCLVCRSGVGCLRAAPQPLLLPSDDLCENGPETKGPACSWKRKRLLVLLD